MSTTGFGAATGAANGPITNTYTVTSLGRWSILNKSLPSECCSDPRLVPALYVPRRAEPRRRHRGRRCARMSQTAN